MCVASCVIIVPHLACVVVGRPQTWYSVVLFSSVKYEREYVSYEMFEICLSYLGTYLWHILLYIWLVFIAGNKQYKVLGLLNNATILGKWQFVYPFDVLSSAC